MHRRLCTRLAALACALFLIAGCATTSRTEGPRLEARLAAAAWDSTTPPGRVAAWTLRECRAGTVVRPACVERSLYTALERGGIALAMGALDSMAAAHPPLRADAHGLAHGLGTAAYRSPETVGETFAACPPTQMSGCYHGLVQGYFLAMTRERGGVGADEMNALCEEQRSRSRFLWFQCAHGLGHGVMAMTGHHLPRALEACEQVRDTFVREQCYSGAFMENVIGATHPHHTAEAHASVAGRGGASAAHGAHGGDAHAGHAMPGGGGHEGHAMPGGAAGGHEGHGAQAQGAGGEAWKRLDPEDLHYPCSVVGEKYRAACYQNQAGAMLFLSRGSVETAVRECAAAPGENARVCFFSLGRNLVARADQDPERSVALCATAPEPGRGWCGLSVSTAMMNLSGDVRPGLRVCTLLEGQATRTECYRTMGSMLTAVEPDPARREQVCATVDPAFLAACRAGAGLAAREE